MYNSLSQLPYVPYRILEHLALDTNAEDIWKLLAYNDYDALSKPNLTLDEKMAMVWRTGKQEDYSVFFTNLVEDAIPESKTILKIYDYYIHADGLYTGTAVYAFDLLYGGTMALVNYNGIPVSRWDLFVNKLMACLNGAYVGGVGTMTFFSQQSRYDLGRTVIGNSRTFTGGQIYMSTMLGDGGVEDGCDN